MRPQLSEDFDLRDPDDQPAGWMPVDPRTRMFRCPIAGCLVCDLDREFHLEWHAKLGRDG